MVCPFFEVNASSRSFKAFGFFLSFFTRVSTAFSAHFSSSSGCFHFKRDFTCGDVYDKRLLNTDDILANQALIKYSSKANKQCTQKGFCLLPFEFCQVFSCSSRYKQVKKNKFLRRLQCQRKESYFSIKAPLKDHIKLLHTSMLQFKNCKIEYSETLKK